MGQPSQTKVKVIEEQGRQVDLRLTAQVHVVSHDA